MAASRPGAAARGSSRRFPASEGMPLDLCCKKRTQPLSARWTAVKEAVQGGHAISGHVIKRRLCWPAAKGGAEAAWSTHYLTHPVSAACSCGTGIWYGPCARLPFAFQVICWVRPAAAGRTSPGIWSRHLAAAACVLFSDCGKEARTIRGGGMLSHPFPISAGRSIRHLGGFLVASGAFFQLPYPTLQLAAS